MSDQGNENATRDDEHEINQKLNEMVQNDPSFKDLLENDPDAAWEKAGVMELAKKVEQENATAAAEAGEEVGAHELLGERYFHTYFYSCRWRASGWLYHQR